MTGVVGQLGWCVVAVEPVHHSICPSVVSFEGAVVLSLCLFLPVVAFQLSCACGRDRGADRGCSSIRLPFIFNRLKFLIFEPWGFRNYFQEF